jgi:ribosome-binding factor A
MKAAHDDKGKSVRLLRIGEQVRHAVADLLARRAVRDPVLENTIVSVSEVRVTPDLRAAIVFVYPLGGEGGDAVIAALKANARFLRGEIAKSLATKYTPDLTFRLDESFDTGAKIDAILRQPHIARDLTGK